MGGIVVLAIVAVFIGAATYSIAQKKGYDGVTAAVIAGILAFIGVVGGVITLIVYACLPTRHVFCPDCGERNIYYLKTCRHCNAPLPDESPQIQNPGAGS